MEPMLFHPACFEVFRQASLRQGGMTIAELQEVRSMLCVEPRWRPIYRHQDVYDGHEDLFEWTCRVGAEYLAANPVFIPALPPILSRALAVGDDFDIHQSAFASRPTPNRAPPADDPFRRLSNELRDEILKNLGSPDIAAVRLASRAFTHLPISLWRHLVIEEMPWLYEAWSTEAQPYYWATVTASDMRKKEKEEKEFQRRRRIIKQYVPDILTEWVNDNLPLEWGKTQERRELLNLTPIRLPRSQTNWYQLYRDITVNWDKLKGLKNRARIWNDVVQLWDVKEVGGLHKLITVAEMDFEAESRWGPGTGPSSDHYGNRWL